MGKQQQGRKNVKRSTLFINQTDASYWLAAGCLLDEEEKRSRASRAGFGLGLGLAKGEDEQEQSSDGAGGVRLPKAPLQFSRPFSRQLPPLPLEVPIRPLPTSDFSHHPPSPVRKPQTLSPTRSAPSTPSSMALKQNKKSPTAPPNCALPPVPAETRSQLLQPPITLHSGRQSPLNGQIPSPNPSLHPGSSLMHDSSPFSYLVHHRSSMASQSSASDTPDPPASCPPQSPNLGVVIISSFPPPPHRAHGVEADCQPERCAPVLPNGLPIHQRTMKPLPPTPERQMAQLSNGDGFRRPGELHAWSVGFDPAGWPHIRPQPSAFHHPDCVYASHTEVPTSLCGCRLNARAGSKVKPSTSAPDLLDMGMQSKKQLDRQQREMQQLKVEMTQMSDEVGREVRKVYRMSDEVKGMSEGVKGISERVKGMSEGARRQRVASRSELDVRDTAATQRYPTTKVERSTPPRRHIRLAEPGERPAAHLPTGPILLPSPSVTLGKRVAKQQPSTPSHTSTTSWTASGPFGRSRAMVSSVRAQNRDTPSPNRNARSPPSPSTPPVPVFPRGPLFTAGHRRQTSSKSSDHSSDSQPSSFNSGDSLSTSVESLAMTPPKARLQDVGAPLMGSISEKGEGKKRAGSPFRKQMAQMQAYADAVQPFPYHLGRQPLQGKGGQGDEVVGCAL